MWWAQTTNPSKVVKFKLDFAGNTIILHPAKLDLFQSARGNINFTAIDNRYWGHLYA
jgi:hypothetical protein